ncbi:MAG: 1-deoxy-D-xylulose-5-phosphate synthase [Nitrospirota bacterium]|jgi:1-deoxy-D-xylulose-5-phosphate synthase
MLEKIESPRDLKDLDVEGLEELAKDLRGVIIDQVSRTGGHLAPSLGVVELSIALHRVFDTPRDKIIWDVGHQAYAHKLLTGRYGRFSTLRKLKGISGFPKMEESPYDAFGTGHSSTSISAATGMIEARDRSGDSFKVVAVIGDGAMTAGLAFEGLNHAGQLGKDLIVVLNDNKMSISRNVGALSAYLNRILTGEAFLRFKKESKQLIESIPMLGDTMSKFARKMEEHVKGFLLPGMVFEELGFNYVGPIDGHNLRLLEETLGKIKKNEGPTLVHVVTHKGKGYEFSEKDPSYFHGTGPFEAETGEPVSGGGSTAYSDAFGEALRELADRDPRIVAITAAMKEGTGLACFAERYPNRFYDVGIAEPHAVTFAAGLAALGMRPVVAVYSTFLQRAYDQIVHDVCLQKLPVVFAIDRGGLVGEDGPTHHGVFDLTYLRHIPNLVLMAPKDHRELREMLSLALKHDGPSAIRFPRGKVKEAPACGHFDVGEGETLREGHDVSILAIGSTVGPALAAAGRLQREGISAGVFNMRFCKPLDLRKISEAAGTGRIVTVEENSLQGGFGSAVLEALHRMDLGRVEARSLGIPDQFIEHGSQAELRRLCGIDEEGIYNASAALVREDLKFPAG